MDPSQDVRLVGTGRVSIPDLNDVLSVPDADADSDYFVLCDSKNKR